jgi:hypothetical protein
MDIRAFSRSSGHPIDRFASRFVLSPLGRSTGPLHVACFHLAPGEVVGEHEATVHQLFCVVSGEGWASGRDVVRRPLRAMEAAHWAPGERHAAGSESGLVAVVLEGADLEVLAPPAA